MFTCNKIDNFRGVRQGHRIGHYEDAVWMRLPQASECALKRTGSIIGTLSIDGFNVRAAFRTSGFSNHHGRIGWIPPKRNVGGAWKEFGDQLKAFVD